MPDPTSDAATEHRDRADNRTPVTILTGFLGSGKTTLLNRALADPAMARTAVVINEFGDIGIDHALTTKSDDTILVLENGCLCCTVFGDLVQTLNRLYHAREAAEIAFDQVIIETSGLADLAPVIQAFLSEPTLEGLFRVGAVITTVDTVNGAATLSQHPTSVGQVALADCLLLTKLDLIRDAAGLAANDALIARLRRMNPGALICRTDDSAADPIRLMRWDSADPTRASEALNAWIAHSGFDDAPRHAGTAQELPHRHDDTISSFSYLRDEPIPRETLQLLVASLEKHLGPCLLRVKGLVNVAEEPGKPAVIQGAQHLLHNLAWLPAWPDADQRTRIVFITQGIPRGELEEMVGLLGRVAERTAAARRRGAGG
jgi:G3E family GTPase